MDYIDDAHPEYDISLRVVRFEIEPGSYENIITNLPDIEFDFEDFKDLYHMRWDELYEFSYKPRKCFSRHASLIST